MGWCTGSYLAQDIWDKFRKDIPEHKRQRYAEWLYDLFCNEDADDWDTESNLLKDVKIKFEDE
jgi:hypothetical protein